MPPVRDSGRRPFTTRLPLPLAAALAVVAGMPGAAGAQVCPAANRLKAVELARQAKDHLDARAHAEALDDLRSAYAICPGPHLRRSMGRVYEESGELEEALASFRACVAEGQGSDVAADCQVRAAALQKRLSVAVIRVDASPSDAVVHLDGAALGIPVGKAIEVAPGRHQVEVRAAGRTSYRAMVEARGGREATLQVVLEAPPPAAVEARDPSPAPTPAPGETTPAPAPQDLALPAVVAEPAPVRRSAVGNWVGIGLGSAAFLTGVGFLARWGYDTSRAQPASATYSGDTVSSTNLIIGCVGAGLGAAAIITSAVLLPKDPPVQAAAVPLVGGAAVGISMQW